jgi:hypothetical protein
MCAAVITVLFIALASSRLQLLLSVIVVSWWLLEKLYLQQQQQQRLKTSFHFESSAWCAHREASACRLLRGLF